MIVPDRHWLLTWTTYGTWLPGDERGFVGDVLADDLRICHNLPGTPYVRDLTPLRQYAREHLAGPPVYLTAAHAAVALAQFQETAAYRGWCLLAAAVMRNHAHLVVGVPGDPDPQTLLRDFKSYASRALNRRWPRPASGTWWTEGGSKRKLADVPAAVAYVRDQEHPLVVWVAENLGERPV